MVLVACLCAAALFGTTSTPSVSQTYRQRGAYLVNAVAVCGNCHTPHDAANKPIPGMELAGGREFDIEAGHIVGPNITPDRETGIGDWRIGQIVYALRNGKRPDGTLIGPPMPIEFYRQCRTATPRRLRFIGRASSRCAIRSPARTTSCRSRPPMARSSAMW